jgi:hypothetical protein
MIGDDFELCFVNINAASDTFVDRSSTEKSIAQRCSAGQNPVELSEVNLAHSGVSILSSLVK